jgi:hypothetical protein
VAVESRKFADLIAAECGPIVDITVLQHVKWVMKCGRFGQARMSFAPRLYVSPIAGDNPVHNLRHGIKTSPLFSRLP